MYKLYYAIRLLTIYHINRNIINISYHFCWNGRLNFILYNLLKQLLSILFVVMSREIILNKLSKLNPCTFTSTFGIIPLSAFYLKPNKNIYEYGLAGLLINNILFTILFWKNPIKHSVMHKLDALFARISLLGITGYIVFTKNNSSIALFFILFSIGMGLFYGSNKESCKHWCSTNHTLYHMCFHVFICLAVSCAFIN